MEDENACKMQMFLQEIKSRAHMRDLVLPRISISAIHIRRKY